MSIPMGMRLLALVALAAAATAQDAAPTAPSNPIDEILQAKWKELNIEPNRPSSDQEFLRRATIDLVGFVPEPEDAIAFVQSTRPDKRERKIEALLATASWNDFWSERLASIFLAGLDRRKFLYFGILQQYLRERLVKNAGYDAIVREMLTAKGSNKDEDKSDAFLDAYLFLDRTQRKDLTVQVSKVFMGVQLQCAQCHDHPFERWTQMDFYSIVANLEPTTLRPKGPVDPKKIFEAEMEIVDRPSPGGFRPEGFKVSVAPKFFDGKPIKGAAPRAVFANQLTSPQNLQFARAAVNRFWAHFTGQGLVEPVDDFSVRNPPVLPELLDALVRGFIEHKFDLKWLMRTIATSRAYQLSSTRKGSEFSDEARKYYAYAIVRPMTPEQQRRSLLRAQDIDDLPAQARPRLQAMQAPESDSPGEYTANLQQIMNMLNMDSPTYRGTKARGQGRLADLLQETRNPEEIVARLYWCTVSRAPSQAERDRCLEYARARGTPSAYEDIFFVLLNTNEFYFNH